MKILTAMVSFAGENGIYHSDAIEKDGKIWLVPDWIGDASTPKKWPIRLIGISGVKHQKSIGSPLGDIIVNVPISRAVYEGRVPPTKESGLVVEEQDIPVSSGQAQ